MNEDPILSPAQNYRLIQTHTFSCEWNKESDMPVCGKRARRINSETFRCPEHLPIAFDS